MQTVYNERRKIYFHSADYLKVAITQPNMKSVFALAVFLSLVYVFGAIDTVDELEMPKYIGRWYEMYNSLLTSSTVQRGLHCTTEDYKNDNTKKGRITIKFTGREYKVDGKVYAISGIGDVPNPKRPGEFNVSLSVMPSFLQSDSANYFVPKLGPEVNGQYQYSVVTVKGKAALWILARDIKDFRQNYEKEVLKWCEDNGFDWFWNKAKKVYQEDDCIYSPF